MPLEMVETTSPPASRRARAFRDGSNGNCAAHGQGVGSDGRAHVVGHVVGADIDCHIGPKPGCGDDNQPAIRPTEQNGRYEPGHAR